LINLIFFNIDNLLKNLIEIIKTGTPSEVKSAQKEVEKFWHNVYIPQREKGWQCFSIFLDELKNFEQIKDIDHQVYFINTLKWPLWAIGEEYFDVWAEFILRYIQHPSGKIRQAVFLASDYLIMDIVVDLRFDFNDNKKISDEDRERVRKNRLRFGRFTQAVENLLEKYDEPRFHRYKYIESMPAGVYKSLQKLITENLLRSEYYENLYKDFLREKQFQARPIKLDISQEQILEKRQEIEKELLGLLEETKSDFSLDDIKGIIYNEEETDNLTKVLAMFDQGQGLAEMNEILEVINEAWNYFPHKCLGGFCPMEKILEYQKKQENSDK
jgi:hypothetical protein